MPSSWSAFPGQVPTHIEFPFWMGIGFVRVVYNNKPLPDVIEANTPAPSALDLVDDQMLVDRGCEILKFLT